MDKQKSFSQFILDAVLAIKQEIDDHPLKRRSVPGLISKTNIGRNIIHEAFREVVGNTIIGYQLQRRMEEAGKLLDERHMNIQQIAIKCGYPEQGNFSMDFKKIHKMTPKKWLRRNN